MPPASRILLPIDTLGGNSLQAERFSTTSTARGVASGDGTAQGITVLSDRQSNAAAAPDSTEPAKSDRLSALVRQFMALVGGLRSWVGNNRTRGMVVAGTILLLIVVTIGGWVYLASIAIHTGQQSVSTAFAALDQRRFDEARNIAGSIHDRHSVHARRMAIAAGGYGQMVTPSPESVTTDCNRD